MTTPIAVFAALAFFTPPQTASGQTTSETIVEVRVHGNHTTPDADVLRIAGIAWSARARVRGDETAPQCARRGLP